MIELKKISKRFNEEYVLEKLSCEIPDNAIYGLVGANGAGKSTLLRLINSIYKPDEGKILIDGIEVFDNENIKKDIVFVPDDLFFFAGYSINDMADFYNSFYPKFDKSYVIKLANKLKLDVNKSIETFSKGMKRQCAIILAIATNAKYLFFDETFDGIDPVVRNFFKKLLVSQLEKQDTTIIMTSHNLRELEDVCDNLGLLYKGKILFEGEIDTLKTHMFKVQISLKDEFDKKTFKDFEILSFKKVGSVATIILNDKDDAKERLKKLKPILLDFLPLTLEEMFIYQLEAKGYVFEEIL